MEMAECYKCGDSYSLKRQKLGYETCLACGDASAKLESSRKRKCFAPAYNKGAYMYVTSKSMAKDLGR